MAHNDADDSAGGPDFVEVEEQDFWPSFADIMMTIVIIFLMIMLIFILKNQELIEKLKISVIAEQQTQKTMQLNEVAKQSAEQRLLDAENQISMLRLQVLESQESVANLQIQIDEKNTAIVSLEEAKNNATAALQGLEEENRKNAEKLAAEQSLNQDNATKAKELESLMAQQSGEFETLKKKYDKLLKPARSPKNRFVVEVIYLKRRDQETIEVAAPGLAKQSVSRDKLHSILSDLKEKNPGKIYLKIVFPTGSPITHDEAWSFTNLLLQKYDYYYQE